MMHHYAKPGPDKIPVRIDSSLEAIIRGLVEGRGVEPPTPTLRT
jgi:hypothetical protein